MRTSSRRWPASAVWGDLGHAELEALAHTFSEEVFAEGQRVLPQHVSAGGF